MRRRRPRRRRRLTLPGQVPLAEPYVPYQFLALTTFGHWDEILALPVPPADLSYSYGLAQYARGVAYAATGRNADAQASLDSLVKTRESTIKPDYATAGWSTPATVLEIAEHSLRGEIALRGGDAAGAVDHFKSGRGGGGRPALHRAARLVLPGPPFAGPGAAQGEPAGRGGDRHTARTWSGSPTTDGLCTDWCRVSRPRARTRPRASKQFQTAWSSADIPADGVEVLGEVRRRADRGPGPWGWCEADGLTADGRRPLDSVLGPPSLSAFNQLLALPSNRASFAHSVSGNSPL